jgi:hypothetical protein
MVIAPTDLKLYYSGTTTKNGPGGPQGGMISTFQVPAQTITGGVTLDNTVFADITNSEANTGKTRYVCLYLKNTHGSQSATNIKMWQSSITPGQDSIRLGYSGVAANGHDPLLTDVNTSTYNVPLGTSFSTLNDTIKRTGFYVAATGAPVFGKTITLLELYLQRVGSPTGTLNVRQRKRTSETIHSDYGSINVATISNTAPTLYQFSDPANTGTVHVEDIFTVEYTTGTAANYVQVYRAAGSPIQNMHLVHYSGTQWTNLADFDLSGRMYTAGQGGDQLTPIGVTFENPVTVDTAITLPNLTAGSFVPFWLQNVVPANTSNQLNNTSELRFRVTSPTP